MDVTPWVAAGRQLIDRYGPGEFQIRGTVYQGPVIVFPDHTEAWAFTGFAAAGIELFEPVIRAGTGVELLLVGCGPRLQLLPRPLREAVRAAGLGLEVMDTGAACRTFNILVAEDRRVAAALVAV